MTVNVNGSTIASSAVLASENASASAAPAQPVAQPPASPPATPITTPPPVPAGISVEEFEQGLRLDQYMAGIERNKENFRANFIKAIEFYAYDDLTFFRKLPKTFVLVITDDENADALRDVPLLSRVTVEVGTLKMKMFRQKQHPAILEKLIALLPADQRAFGLRVPVFAFFTPEMKLKGVFSQRLPELSAEMQHRHQAWIQAHPEIKDASETIERMSPITRTRLLQTLFAMTPDQRTLWGRKTITAWQKILAPASLAPASPVQASAPVPAEKPISPEPKAEAVVPPPAPAASEQANDKTSAADEEKKV